MKERYHQTVKIENHSDKWGISDKTTLVDMSIEYALDLICQCEKKERVLLVSAQVFEIETQPLPPRRELHILVIAESID